MSGFGPSALTLASHASICLAVLMIFAEALRLAAIPDGIGQVLRSHYARLSAFTVLSMMVVERLYYAAARLLRPLDVDLWAAHPAPEFLSGALSLSLFNLVVAARLATDPQPWTTIAQQFTVLVVVWVSIAVTLF
jgi:predicted Co/Zn/Cd cation transporter (cation efflux family)